MELNSKEKKILERVEEDQSYSNWFFKQAQHIKWFYPLKNKYYFSPNSIQYDKNDNALPWRTLAYLERISDQVLQYPEYGKELIEIIKDFLKSSANPKEKQINNPYIWKSFIVILSNIPDNIIQENFPLQNNCFLKLLEICSNFNSTGLLTREIGETLLKKFLANPLMLEYAEAIIDSMTEIKPGNKKRGLLNRDEAVLKWEPFWVMEAFEKNNNLIGEKSKQAVTIVANKLANALEYDSLNNVTNVIIGSNVYEIMVTRKMVKNSNDIVFERHSYILEIKQYSKKQLKDVNIQEGLWGLFNIDPETLILAPNFFMAIDDKSFKNEILKLLPPSINWHSFSELDLKLSNLYKGLFEDHSQIWFKSLSGGDRRHISDACEGLTIILRDLLSARSKTVSDKCKSFLQNFLTSDYPFSIFQRFVLYFIDQYWDEGFDNLFIQFLESPFEVLKTETYEVELHKILRNHNKKFSKKLIKKVKDLIDDVPNYYSEHGEKYVNYWKYKWLSPLKDNPDFTDDFNQAKSNSKFETNKNGYTPDESTFEMGLVHHKASLSDEEIKRKHHDKSLVDEFNNFKKFDRSRALDGLPDRQGLGDSFQKLVAEDPEYFLTNVEQYQTSPPFFIHKLLWGLNEAFKSKKTLEWSKILDFYIPYLGLKQTFLSDNSETEDGDTTKNEYLWTIGDMADLIENGSNDNTLQSVNFDQATRFFELASTIVHGEINPDIQGDVVNYAYNTILGKVSRSSISFGLRVARDAKNKKIESEKKWGQKNYDRYFNVGIESYIWFGYFYPHMRYLDKDYSESKLKELSERNKTDLEWQAFMEAYLFGSTLHDEIYHLPAMRQNYEKAIDFDGFDKKEDNSLVCHITIAYLRGNEELTENNKNGEESLFWKMLHNIDSPDKTKRWLGVASYFWSISPKTTDDTGNSEDANKLKKEMVNRIIDFWRWSYNNKDQIKELLKNQYYPFLARLADLTIYLDKIDDENEKWLLESAPFCNLEHMSSFFIEYLTKFLDDDKSMKRVGKIYLKILEGTTPDFRKEHIYCLIERLYQLKDKYPKIKNEADRICNIYAEREDLFLKELFDKYQ